MKVGDLVNVTEKRGSGSFRRVVPRGLGLVLDIQKTDDLTIGSVGPINLGDNVTVHLSDSGEVKHFTDRCVEVISEYGV